MAWLPCVATWFPPRVGIAGLWRVERGRVSVVRVCVFVTEGDESVTGGECVCVWWLLLLLRWDVPEGVTRIVWAVVVRQSERSWLRVALCEGVPWCSRKREVLGAFFLWSCGG